jgi:hypothetical protein
LAPISILHGHAADDTLSMPASRRLLTRMARFFEQAGHRSLLLAPPLQVLPYPTGARDERDEPYLLLQAQPERAFTIRLTVGHDATHPVEPKRHARLNRYGGLCAVIGIAIAHTQAEGQAITAHPQPQEHLLESIMPIFAVPIRRARGDWPVALVGLLLIGAIEGDRRRSLLEPGGREGLPFQGLERDRTKQPVQIRRKQPIEALSQPVILE